MKDIDDKSVDMILCDLPYGTTACKWDTIIPFELLWLQYSRIIKDNGAIVLFGSQPFTSQLITSNLKMFKCEWIYNKTRPSGMAIAKYQPMKEHENILVFGKNRVNYHPIMKERPEKEKRKSRAVSKSGSSPLAYISSEKRQYDTFFPRTILKFSNGYQQKRLHPTEKPVELCEYLIKTYTNENETVLDNCMGSGTTGVACKNTNRKFIGIEKDLNYYNIACERIKEVVINVIY